MITIDLVPSNCNDLFFKKIINRAFKELLEYEDNQPCEYPLNQSEYSSNLMFEDLIDFIEQDQTTGFYKQYTFEQLSSFVIGCGVTPERIIEWVTNFLNTQKVPKKIRQIFISINEYHNQGNSLNISDKRKQKYLQRIKDYNRPIQQITELEAEAEYLNGNDNIWAVRSQFGDFECLFYKINAPRNEFDNYVVRYQYAIDLSCNYYQVRELLYSGWLKKDEEHKYATQP